MGRQTNGMKPYVNPCWTSDAKPQPNIDKGGDVPELRQMLGSGKIAETFKQGARHYPICPGCGLEVAPGNVGKVLHVGETAYERILILNGLERTITYCKECESKAPEHVSLLEQVLKKG